MHPGSSSDKKNMSEASAWIEKHLGISALVQTNLVETLIALLLIILIRLVVLKVVRRYTADDVRLYEWRRNSLYLAAFTAILAGGRIWWEGFQSVITFLGLVSAGMAIALRDVIVNITGWLFLVWRRPFQVSR